MLKELYCGRKSSSVCSTLSFPDILFFIQGFYLLVFIHHSFNILTEKLNISHIKTATKQLEPMCFSLGGLQSLSILERLASSR